MKYKKVMAAIGCLLACMLFAACQNENSTTTGTQGEDTVSISEEAQPDASSAEAENTSTQDQSTYFYENEDGGWEAEVFAMDTYMTLTAYGDQAEEAVRAGVAEIQRLDALLSTGDAASEIGQINANGGGELSEESEYLLDRAMEIYESTGGAFDITIYPVMELWGFTTGDFSVPDESELQETLALVGADKIIKTEDGQGAELSLMELSDTSGSVRTQEIDFGGIAKGYTSDRVIEIFREYGIESGKISLGGNVYVLGNKTDGTPWKVGIQDPEDSGECVGGISIADKAVITSGGYERYFEEGNVTYHHIIDPKTGYPANNGLISVTIVSEDGTLADGLSTSLFVLGTEDAIDYCEKNCRTDGFDAILEAEDGTIYITEGIQEDYLEVGTGGTPQIIEYEKR